MKLIELINKYTYNYAVQFTFFCLWFLGLTMGPILLQVWFIIGLVIWGGMMAYRQQHGHRKPEERYGILPYLVGLNWAVILSLLSPILIYLLAKSDEDSGENL